VSGYLVDGSGGSCGKQKSKKKKKIIQQTETMKNLRDWQKTEKDRVYL